MTQRLCPLADAAEQFADEIAVCDRGRRVSYAALHREAQRAADGLAKLGVSPGDPVAFQLPPSERMIALLWACFRLYRSTDSRACAR